MAEDEAKCARPSSKMWSYAQHQRQPHPFEPLLPRSRHRPATTQAPAIAADLANPAAPKTILGLIVQALKHRQAAGIPPFTVLSCDNLPNNGKLAKAAVLAYARQTDPGLADWIETHVAFPCTMVDRITPATTDADRAHLADKPGVEDAWPVMTEQLCNGSSKTTSPWGVPTGPSAAPSSPTKLNAGKA